MPKPTLSVIVPVYRGSATVALLVSQVDRFFAENRIAGEIILVNDGSPDASWERIQEVVQSTPNVRGVNLMRNYGQHNALLCGIRLATGAIIVTMDDDLQHPPSEIPQLLEKLDTSYDVVYGTPRQEQHGLWRDMASHSTNVRSHYWLYQEPHGQKSTCGDIP